MISIDELEGRINDRLEVELKYFEIKGSVLFRPRTYILIHSMVSPALSLPMYKCLGKQQRYIYWHPD